MSQELTTYLIFGGLITLALIFDLGLLSKKSSHITIKKALWQTIFWVSLALGFMVFVWYTEGQKIALEFLSAYLTEWSLSVDNIFVFILIFSFFGIKSSYYARVLLIGIIMAIVFRIIFITVGIVLVEKFHWILYVFGVILAYTGIKMFSSRAAEEINVAEYKVYRFLKRMLPLVPDDGDGKFTVIRDGKKYYTTVFVVVVLLATTDIVFALDSIPAVFGISQNRLVVYTSNIFAVLGLRSLFFLLQGAVNKFAYLQQGIAVVLIFIGCKMLAEIFHVRIPVYISLLVIVICLAAAVVYSIAVSNRRQEEERSIVNPNPKSDTDF